jgi:hypothetical protein
MTLDWARPGVLQVTVTVAELATLVAGARMAAAALAGPSGAQAREIERVLASFDRAVAHLPATPPATTSGSTAGARP